MDWKFILIQALGLLGSVAVISAVQFDNRKIVLGAQTLACVLWVVHYTALGAMTAVFINLISLSRSIIFYFNHKPWAKSRLWLWLFMAAFILNSVFTWDGIISILPAIGMCASTGALWTHNKSRMRGFYLLSSPPWLIYNFICGSYSCAIVEIFAFISYVLAIYRFDIKKTEKEEQ